MRSHERSVLVRQNQLLAIQIEQIETFAINFYVVIKHTLILFKVAVGSVPPNFSPKLLECEERPWKKENFQITFLQRVQSTASSRFSEQRLVVSFRLSKMMI